MQSQENSSGGFFAMEDAEHSQSQSQVRARRAIRLDSQVSLHSHHEGSGHNESHDSDAEEDSQAMSGNPRSMFAPRDINAMPIDVKQRQQMLMRSNPSSRPRSRKRGNDHESMSHKSSSASRPPLGLRMQNQLSRSAMSSRHASRSSHAHYQPLQREDDENGEETVMMVGGVVLSTRSGPPSATASLSVHSPHDGSNYNSPSPARPATAEDHVPAHEHVEKLEASFSQAMTATSTAASPTPPPRRAFVLSRLPSLGDKAPSLSTTPTQRAREQEKGEVSGKAPEQHQQHQQQRESLLLVGNVVVPPSTAAGPAAAHPTHQHAEARASPSATAEATSFILSDLPPPPFTAAAPIGAAAAAAREGEHTSREAAQQRVTVNQVTVAATATISPPQIPAHRVLKPGQVVEEGGDSPDTPAQPTGFAMGTSKPFTLAAGNGSSFTDALGDDSSILSPLPRPVHPPPMQGRKTEEKEGHAQDGHIAESFDSLYATRSTEATAAETTAKESKAEKGAAGPTTAPGVASEESGSMVMPYSIVSSAAPEAGPPTSAHTAADATAAPLSSAGFPTDSIFIQSSVFLSGTSQSLAQGSHNATKHDSMLLVGGDTPTPLRELRENIRSMYGPKHEERAQEPKGSNADSAGGDAAVGHQEVEVEEGTIKPRSPPPRDPAMKDPIPSTVDKVDVAVAAPTFSPSRTPQHHGRTSFQEDADANASPTQQQQQQRRPTSLLGTPSARISDEVKELVERAQEEVRRTRSSLLSNLQSHKASFVPAVAATTAAATTANKEEEGEVQTGQEDDRPPTTVGARQLDFTEEDEAKREESPFRADAVALPAREALFFANWSLNQLRSRLCESADSILRRLKGYDRGNHGVLPMDVVVKVTFFVLNTRFGSNVDSSNSSGTAVVKHLFTEESLAFLSSTAMETPLAGGRPSPDSTAHRREQQQQQQPFSFSPANARGNGAGTTPKSSHSLLSPRAQEWQMREVLVSATPGVYARGSGSRSSLHNVTVSSLTKSSGSRTDSGRKAVIPHGTKRSRADRDGDAVGEQEQEEEEEECRGRPATRMSPTRTLERVLAQQAARAAEEGFLSFYLFLLSAFRDVFGERYALRHLGATNASKHDLPLTESSEHTRPHHGSNDDGDGKGARSGKRRLALQFSTTLADGTVAWAQDGGAAGRPALASLSDIEGPLESAFPRLRQNYGVREGGALADGKPDPRRTPPLDVLVYYETYVESLREL